MATFSRTGDFGKARERIERLRLKLENPQPLTEQLAASLVGYLEQNVPVASGTLKEGLLRVVIQSPTHASIGDTSVLTSWEEKPPAGTIGDFVKWLRQQNEQKAKIRGQRISEKARGIQVRQKARVATYQSRYAGFKQSVERIIKNPKGYSEKARGMRRSFSQLNRQTVFVPGRGYVKMTYAEQHAAALKILGSYKFQGTKAQIGGMQKLIQEQFQYEFRTKRR